MTDEPNHTPTVLVEGRTFRILQDGKATSGKAILCLKCNRTSYLPADVEMRYCAACDWMHEHGRKRTLADVAEWRDRSAAVPAMAREAHIVYNAEGAKEPRHREVFQGIAGVAEQLPPLAEGHGVVDAWVLCMNQSYYGGRSHFVLCILDLDVWTHLVKDFPDARFSVAVCDLGEGFRHAREYVYADVFGYTGTYRIELQFERPAVCELHIMKLFLRLALRDVAENIAEGFLPPIMPPDDCPDFSALYTSQVKHCLSKHIGLPFTLVDAMTGEEIREELQLPAADSQTEQQNG